MRPGQWNCTPSFNIKCGHSRKKVCSRTLQDTLLLAKRRGAVDLISQGLCDYSKWLASLYKRYTLEQKTNKTDERDIQGFELAQFN